MNQMVQVPGRVEVIVERRIAATPTRVFELVARIEDWPRWTFPDEATRERDGAPDPDGVGALRRLRTGRRVTREDIVAFEAPTTFAYTLLEGLPLRNYRADVTIRPDGAGCIVRWHSRFDPKLPGTGALWRLGIRKLLGRITDDLAVAAEATG
jgi:Polyketide cyclase / dehydrase and lipid transport